VLIVLYLSELADPQKLLPDILQPDILRLSPETIAVYIQAASKIFGFWATELAERWTDEHLPEIKGVVDLIVSRTTELVASPHIEVQERVGHSSFHIELSLSFFSFVQKAANTLQLFNFIQADLNAYRIKPQTSPGFSATATSFDPIAPAEPHFPKSLYLIQPLFTSYELNPVALAAQASVPVPEGLDLDAWIAPPPRESTPALEESSERRPKKSKKGKGKEVDGSIPRSGRKKHKEQENGNLLTPASETETPEEQAERARVRTRLELLELFGADTACLFSAKQNDWNSFETTRTTSSTISLPK
jgi:AP-3 complex subunit delta-1